MVMTVNVEGHPENGKLPWVVVVRGGPFCGEYWFACKSRKQAERRADLFRRLPFETARLEAKEMR